MGIQADNHPIHYCPFCGKSLGQQCGMRYCPFCGGNLAAICEMEPVNTVEETDMGINYAGRGKPSRTEQAKAGPSQSGAVRSNEGLNTGFYSLILKYCPTDRQVLTAKLQNVLLRSPRAIQLALESAPCILVYKEKADKVLKVMAACRDAGAAVILVTADTDMNRHIKDAFPGFHKLSEDLRIFLPAFPNKLWIGENIAGIYGVTTQDKGAGALVVGEHALYFVGRKYDWLAVSYQQIKDIFLSEDAVEVEYHGCDNTELFYFADNDDLEQAFTQLKKTSQSEQGRWQVDAHCSQCNFHSRDWLKAAKTGCPQCGRELVCEILPFSDRKVQS